MTIYHEQCFKCVCTTSMWDNGDGSDEQVERGLCGDCGCSEGEEEEDDWDWDD